MGLLQDGEAQLEGEGPSEEGGGPEEHEGHAEDEEMAGEEHGQDFYEEEPEGMMMYDGEGELKWRRRGRGQGAAA